jgi:hypothetical protein
MPEARTLEPVGRVLGGVVIGSDERPEQGYEQEEREDDRPGQSDRLPAEPVPIDAGPPEADTPAAVCFDLPDHLTK